MFAFEHPSSTTIIAYTHGSCPNNRTVSFDNPAGSGFALASGPPLPAHPPKDATWLQSLGKVRATPTQYLHTGELKALIELFDYLLYHSPFQKGDDPTVYTDSQCALTLLLGSSIPTAHHQLVVLAQKYYTALRCCHRVSLRKVPSREGIPGNELADALAKRSVHSFGTLGRFSSSPSQSLQPADTGFDKQRRLSLSTREQNDFLLSKIKAATPLIPVLPLAAKKPWISSHTLHLIHVFQNTTFTDTRALKASRNAI